MKRKKTLRPAAEVIAILKSYAVYDPITGQFIVTKKYARRCKPVGSTLGTMSSKGYLIIQVEEVQYRLHRLAWAWMTGDWPENVIDHINGKEWDNRWENLRDVTTSIQNRNRRKSSNNVSGYNGVAYNKVADNWQVQPIVNKKPVYLGRFSTPEEAAAVRRQFEADNPHLGFTVRHGK